MQDHPAKPLFGKTALVTGAARRLGRASALMLAQAGADVGITFRNSARVARETVVDLSGFGVRASVSFHSILGVVPEETREWKPEIAPQAMVTNRKGNSLPLMMGPPP